MRARNKPTSIEISFLVLRELSTECKSKLSTFSRYIFRLLWKEIVIVKKPLEGRVKIVSYKKYIFHDFYLDNIITVGYFILNIIILKYNNWTINNWKALIIHVIYKNSAHFPHNWQWYYEMTWVVFWFKIIVIQINCANSLPNQNQITGGIVYS